MATKPSRPIPPSRETRPKIRAPRNRTLTVEESEVDALRNRILTSDQILGDNHVCRTILADCFQLFGRLPRAHVDLLILDPPYNLNKKFGSKKFSKRPAGEYTKWLDDLFYQLLPLLKPNATVYICGDWLTSTSIFASASRFFTVRNRITWEREKGRGAKSNWKTASEDIWFCTVSDRYVFNVNDVKLRRRVIAPYRNADGSPKDWQETRTGNYRDTHPSNLWTDITIPFWSMPENTDHPTQKSEKLIAKLILASSNPGDMIFDPFLGSGTSSVVAKKLGRQFFGIEIEEVYALLTEKRLSLVDADKMIQGYDNQVFWERNTRNLVNGNGKVKTDRRNDSNSPQLPFN